MFALEIFFKFTTISMQYQYNYNMQYQKYLLILSVAPDAYSTIDQRGRRNTLDDTLDRSDRDTPQVT